MVSLPRSEKQLNCFSSLNPSIMTISLFLYDAENVFLVHDEIFNIFYLDFCPGVFPVKDLVSDFDVHGDKLSLIGGLAFSHGDHFTFLRLLFSSVRNDNATLFNFLLLKGLYSTLSPSG